MAPFYELICEEQGWPVDSTLLDSMKKENEETLKKLDDRLKDAEENLGETEISDTLLARAEHFAKIGDKVTDRWICWRTWIPLMMSRDRLQLT